MQRWMQRIKTEKLKASTTAKDLVQSLSKDISFRDLIWICKDITLTNLNRRLMVKLIDKHINSAQRLPHEQFPGPVLSFFTADP